MDSSQSKWPIWTTAVAMILAFSAVAVIMFRVDPFSADKLEKTIFFFSSFMGTWGLATLIFFSVRRLWSKHLPSLQVFNISLWHGFLLSILLTGVLIYKVRSF